MDDVLDEDWDAMERTSRFAGAELLVEKFGYSCGAVAEVADWAELVVDFSDARDVGLSRISLESIEKEW